MFDVARLLPWLRKHTLNGRDGRRCLGFVLAHVPSSGEPVDLDGWSFNEEDGIGDGFAEEIVEAFRIAVEQHAAASKGFQRYRIYARFDGADPYTFPFANGKAARELLNGEASLETEPATSQGLLAQMMRHDEAKTSMYLGGYARMHDLMSKRVEFLEGELAERDRKRLRDIDLVEKMASRQQKRELAAKRTEASIELRQDMFRQFKPLVPLIGRAVMQKHFKQLPGSPLGNEASIGAVDSFFDALTRDQAQKIVETLDAAGTEAFVALAKDHAARMKKRKEDEDEKGEGQKGGEEPL